jgi:hypothetical protein
MSVVGGVLLFMVTTCVPGTVGESYVVRFQIHFDQRPNNAVISREMEHH